MESSLTKLILFIILSVVSVRRCSAGSIGFGTGLRSEDFGSIDRYVSSGLPYSSDGFVFNSGMGPVIVNVEQPNKVTRAVEQAPTTSYYRSLPSVIPEGYEGVATTSFVLGHPIPSTPPAGGQQQHQQQQPAYSYSSHPTQPGGGATSYANSHNVYTTTHYTSPQPHQIQPSPSHLSYSTNLPPPSYQYQPPQELQAQRQPQPVTYNSIPQTQPPQQIFTRAPAPAQFQQPSSLQPQPQGPPYQTQFQPSSPQPQQFPVLAQTQYQAQQQGLPPQYTTSAQPQQYSTSVQPQQQHQQQYTTSVQPQFQTSAQPQRFQTSVQPQQFQSSPQPQPQAQQFQQLQSQAFPLSTQPPQQRSISPSQSQVTSQSVRSQNSLGSGFPEKDEFGYDRSLIPTNFIGGTGFRSREELVTNPVVQQTFDSDSELPEHLRNPFYSNSIIAEMLARESLPAQGEMVVGNWETNKIREGRVRDLLNGAGLV